MKSFNGDDEVLLPSPLLRGRNAGVRIESISQASLSPSGLFVIAVAFVSRAGQHKKEQDLAVWFHDLSLGHGDGDGEWISLGVLGVAQLVKSQPFVTDKDSKLAVPPAGDGCTMAVDWLQDDSALVIMRVQAITSHSNPSTDTVVGVLTAADLLDRCNTLIDWVGRGAPWGHTLNLECDLRHGSIDALRAVLGGCEEPPFVEEEAEEEVGTSDDVESEGKKKEGGLASVAVAASLQAADSVSTPAVTAGNASDSDDDYDDRPRRAYKSAVNPSIVPDTPVVVQNRNKTADNSNQTPESPNYIASGLVPEEPPVVITPRHKVCFVLWSGSRIFYCALSVPVRYPDLIQGCDLDVVFVDVSDVSCSR